MAVAPAKGFGERDDEMSVAKACYQTCQATTKSPPGLGAGLRLFGSAFRREEMSLVTLSATWIPASELAHAEGVEGVPCLAVSRVKFADELDIGAIFLFDFKVVLQGSP